MAAMAVTRRRSSLFDDSKSDLVFFLWIAVALSIYLGYAIHTGLPWSAALAASVSLIVTQLFPGIVIWRAIRPTEGWLIEDLAAGFAIGMAIAVPTQVIAGLTHQRWLASALPLAIAVAVLSNPAARTRVLTARFSRLPSWLGPTCAFLTLIPFSTFRLFVRTNLLVWDQPGAPFIDTYIHQSLAAELLNRGPVQWPAVVGEQLGYHWFGHAWIAQVSASSSTGIDEVLVRFLPAIMPLFVVIAAAAAGLRLSGSPKVAGAAATLTMIGSSTAPAIFGRSASASPLKPESPTLGLGAPTLTLLVVCLVLGWKGEIGVWPRRVLVTLLAIIAAGTKGSTVPIVVAGLGLAAAAMYVIDRKKFKPIVEDFVLVSTALAVVMIVVFRGSSAGLQFGLGDSARQTHIAALLQHLPTKQLAFIAAATTFLGLLARMALAPFMVDDEHKREPIGWLLIGIGLSASAAAVVFAHPGRSQYYFPLTAIPIMSLASALGAQRLWRRFGQNALAQLVTIGAAGGLAMMVLPKFLLGSLAPGQYDKATRMVVVAALITAIIVCIVWRWGLAPRGRAPQIAVAVSWLFLCVGAWFTGLDSVDPAPIAVKSLDHVGAVSQNQINAARYIRDNSGVNEIVMTNRHCTGTQSPFDVCDSRHWLVAANAERQVLVEGWSAAPRATEIAPDGRDSITVPFWKPELLRMNDDFIARPTKEARNALWDMGVRWVYVEFTRPHADDLQPYATLEFDSPDAQAWKLNPPTGDAG